MNRLTRRKFNHIDLAAAFTTGFLVANGEYVAGAVAMFVGVTISVLAERKFGI